MATLLVDDREQAVHPFLAGKNVPFLIKRITTGDFCIIRQNPENPADDRILAIFERKSLNDFAASIKDGRYDNYIKMIEMQKEYDGCQLYYIIECARAFPAMDDKFDRIPYANISAAINKLEIVYGIQIIKTKDPDDTAARLSEKVKGYDKYWEEIGARYKAVISARPAWPAELVKLMKIILLRPETTIQELKVVYPNDYKLADCVIKETIPSASLDDYIYILQNKETHPLAAKVILALAKANKEWETYQPNKLMNNLTEVKHKSLDEIRLRMWMEIPGISWAIAPALNSKYSIAQYINKEITETSLESINYTNGKKIHGGLVKTLLAGPNDKVEIAILQCIPNLGQKAEHLIKVARLAELIKLSENQLAGIKTGKTCLGLVKAAEILATIK